MDQNSELNLAWQLVQNTGCNVFLTGKAGTGKTTFLRRLYTETHKRAVILAPTGIAAINAGGSTLHSFFQLSFGPFVPGTQPATNERSYKFSDKKRKLIRSLDLVIIDEISMVRADLLDSVDAVLRRFRDRTRPFGGVQMLLIGDLQQLAPVVKPDEWTLLQPYYSTPFFFASKALQEAGYVTVELQRVYRQNEQDFIDILNKVRVGEADASTLATLNQRFVPDFQPKDKDGYIRLVTHNRQADAINQQKMSELDSEPHTYTAEIWQDFPESSYPLPAELTLKVGAQVMFVKNDSLPQKRYFNGMLGTVISMSDSFVKVRTHDNDSIISVTPEQWENTRYDLDETSKEIQEKCLGTFAQLPLKPAWAITVHKSQGLTFNHAVIDVQYSFSHGQTYVALSRCRSLDGLILSSPIPAHAIINDASIVAFTRSIPAQTPSAEKVELLKRDYYLKLVAELFTFHALRNALDAYLRHIEEWLTKQHPEAIALWREARQKFRDNIDNVSITFSQQYQRLILSDFDYASNTLLQERCRKGAKWFCDQIAPLLPLFKQAEVSTKNKTVAEREHALRDELKREIKIKILLLTHVQEKGFNPDDYLHERALASMADDKKEGKRAKTVNRTINKPKHSTTHPKNYTEALGEENSYDTFELNETEIELPDLQHDDLPY